jgi:hypothetical protein
MPWSYGQPGFPDPDKLYLMLLTAVENESPGLLASGQRFEGNEIALPITAHEHS